MKSFGTNGHSYKPTSHPDIVLVEDEDILAGDALVEKVEELIHLAREGDVASIIQILDECIPGAAMRSTPTPDLTSFV